MSSDADGRWSAEKSFLVQIDRENANVIAKENKTWKR